MIMKSKGYQKFETRLVYFREDFELVDVLFLNKEKLKSDDKIFMMVNADRHPLLSGRESKKGSRKNVMTHLKKSIFVSFLKEMYEEVTEYIRYILLQGSINGVEPKRIVGEHNFKMQANDILSLATKEDVIRAVTDQIFQQLESERSTIELFQKTKNKLGLNVSQELIDKSIPYLTCRHIFVHSDGKPNDEFKAKYPEIRLDKKNRIALDLEFLNAAYKSVNDLLKAYDAEMIQKNYISQAELVV